MSMLHALMLNHSQFEPPVLKRLQVPPILGHRSQIDESFQAPCRFFHLSQNVLSSRAHRVPTWKNLASIPFAARQEHTTVFLPPSTIAILGGIIPSNGSDSIIPVETVPLMQFYSIPDDTWTSRAPVPRALNHLNVAVVKGKIYVLGGLTESGNATTRAWSAVSDSWVYDPIVDTWESVLAMPLNEARGSAAVGVYDGKIYLAGGMTMLELFGNRTQDTVSIVSIYDTRNRTWLTVPKPAKQIPEGRDHAGAAVIGSRMYILGGRNHAQLNVKDTVFILDLCNLEAGWRTSDERMPTARGGVTAGTIGRKIYTFGGEGNPAAENKVFDEVEVYDTVANRWESVGTMVVPRHGTYAVGVGRGVYIPGGGVVQGGAPVADFNVFIP
ncbi:galactose oxidase [Plenodomus tracheiphilus IPT5]|uniref:Galactose oxidase n=1 Tax=Plenodomus tracheiphilus IPT5 TaxID=1408161 RepID=A0A6A7AVL1_9PLEO|nr:galactose oxidase [Plenodomus tracheiphilus IPT5]